MSVHSIAEVYAALARLPVQPRIHPLEALRILSDNIMPHFVIIPISKKDYLEALNTVGNGGWSGGKIYDALLLCCAAKNPVERLYTFNITDFKQLAPPGLQRDHLRALIAEEHSAAEPQPQSASVGVSASQ